MSLPQPSYIVPDLLGSNPQITEKIIEEIFSQGEYVPACLDMANVKFIKPYGAIILVMSIRQIASLSQQKIQLVNLRPEIFQFLHRMDFFTVAREWIQFSDVPEEQWSRNPQTPNLLELTIISGSADVNRVVGRAEQIFSRWLKSADLNRILTVLSELCANIYQHSGDSNGCTLIQRYEHELYETVEVSLAFGDLGQGVRGSLLTRFPDIDGDPLFFLNEAMHGRSARNTGRGGLGLRHVEEIVRNYKGQLRIRSESAAIASIGPNSHTDENSLTYFPGTQLAVRLNSSLST